MKEKFHMKGKFHEKRKFPIKRKFRMTAISNNCCPMNPPPGAAIGEQKCDLLDPGYMKNDFPPYEKIKIFGMKNK